MLHKALKQFLEDVEWGALDFLLIDLPPGTGDVSMTLAQLLPQATLRDRHDAAAGGPARRAPRGRDGAQGLAGDRGRDREHVGLRRRPTGERYAIFGEGGGQALAEELDVPLLGRVPLTMPLREHADAGVPLVLEDPDDPASQAIRHAARGLIALAPLELPVLSAAVPPSGNGAPASPPPSSAPAGMSLPMA